ncbi:MAG: ABC transporter substrate-binding protein [Deltaproteobacteria bacterium]|nr:ABC transporter substrate-binding protein [Deltaproteobacteria bacterium]
MWLRGGKLTALALALALVSCGDGEGSPRDEPIVVGVIVSLSGPLGSVGDHLAKSAQLAAREVNAAGGLLGGRQIELIVVDDRTDPAQAARVAQDLLDQGAIGIIGSLSSSATEEVQAVTAAQQTPQISCCSTSQNLTDIQPADDRYLFRTAPSDTEQAQVLADVAVGQSCERVAILHINDAYGEPFAEGINQSLTGEPTVEVVEVVPFVGGRSNYDTEVQAVATANPDCIALVAFPDDGGEILRAWNSLGSPPDVTWIGSDGLKDPGFPTAAGDPSFVEGVIGTAPIVEPDTRSANAFAASYEVTYGERPGIFGGNQYDAMILLALAIQKAGTTDGTAVRDALYQVANRDAGEPTMISGQIAQALGALEEPEGDIDYEGASGSVDLDPSGDVTSDYEIWSYTGGMFVRVDVISPGGG